MTDNRAVPPSPVDLPRLQILGAPKAGTTTLAAWWDLHPQGFTAPEKEVEYFTVRYRQGAAWYRSRYDGMAPGQVGCDASPGYLYAPHALDRMRRDVPDARLVAVLREPVARMWSHWCYFTALGVERRSFEVVLRDAETGFAAGGADYAAFSRYLLPLRSVVDRFPRAQLLVLLTDDLRADRQGVFDQLSDHAGVERAPLPDVPDRNEGRFPRSPALQRTLQRAHAGAWPGGVGRRLMAQNVRPGGPPPLDPADRARLAPLFRRELDLLEDWLGRDLPASWRAGAA
jgi:hypothetical protein